MSTGTPSGREARPTTVTLLALVLGFLGTSGVAGGIGLLGGQIALPREWLAGSPFDSYVVPALSLFAFLGVLPLVVGAGLYARKPWAWPGVVATGIGVLVWFAVQASVVGWGHALQWFYLGVGVAILVGAALPSVRRHVGAAEFVDRLGGGDGS